MKKLFAALFAGAMVLTACSGGDAPEEPKEETKKVELTEEDKALEDLAINKGMAYTEAKAIINDNGYTATYIYGGEDWGEVLDLYPEEDLAEYLVKGVEDIDPEDKTITIELDTKTNVAYNEAEQALNEKLNQTSALIAVKEYGQRQYGDEFELHYMMGLNDASAKDENTWSFKIEAELEDEDKTVDAEVTGTTDNPEVIAFDIY